MLERKKPLFLKSPLQELIQEIICKREAAENFGVVRPGPPSCALLTGAKQSLVLHPFVCFLSSYSINTVRFHPIEHKRTVFCVQTEGSSSRVGGVTVL